MKWFDLRISVVLIILLSCTDDEVEMVKTNGPLKQVNEYFDDRLAVTYELFYNDINLLDSVNIVTDVSMITGVKLSYAEGELSRVNYTLLRNGFTIKYYYDILQLTDELIAIDRQSNRTIVFQHTDGFIDAYRIFITTDPEFMTEGVFVRDAEQNIQSISFYESNAVDKDFFIFEYTYSDFDKERTIPAVFNPVFDRSFFDFRLPYYLGLKFSNDTPLASSYRDGNGTYIENNIIAEITDIVNGAVKRLTQTRKDIPDVLTEIEFIY